MNLVSIQAGLPREVEWRGRIVKTGIFKEPVNGPVMVRSLNLDGDRQADLSVHGGPDKALYGYPVEHYEFWRNEFPEMDLPYGMFGENLTTRGLLENEANIGNHYRVGGAELVVTQARLPCYKLGIKFGRDDILKRFLMSRRSGMYFRVVGEGEIRAGDEIRLVSRDHNNVTVADMVRVFAFDKNDLETLRRIMEVPALPESWREHFRHQLEQFRV